MDGSSEALTPGAGWRSVFFVAGRPHAPYLPPAPAGPEFISVRYIHDTDFMCLSVPLASLWHLSGLCSRSLLPGIPLSMWGYVPPRFEKMECFVA